MRSKLTSASEPDPDQVCQECETVISDVGECKCVTIPPASEDGVWRYVATESGLLHPCKPTPPEGQDDE